VAAQPQSIRKRNFSCCVTPFEVWQYTRVELKTDALNQKSRAAILRIGARERGTLRRHVVTWTGRVRDSVYFSILDSEWPEVKARLEAKLAAR